MRSESTSAFGQPSETNPIVGAGVLLLLLGIVLGLLTSGKTREGEAREHVARLALHLLLELREHLLALLHVRLHQALHRRALQVHELRPQLLRGARVVAVHAMRLLLQRLLYVLERADVTVQVAAPP